MLVHQRLRVQGHRSLCIERQIWVCCALLAWTCCVRARFHHSDGCGAISQSNYMYSRGRSCLQSEIQLLQFGFPLPLQRSKSGCDWLHGRKKKSECCSQCNPKSYTLSLIAVVTNRRELSRNTFMLESNESHAHTYNVRMPHCPPNAALIKMHPTNDTLVSASETLVTFLITHSPILLAVTHAYSHMNKCEMAAFYRRRHTDVFSRRTPYCTIQTVVLGADFS